MTTNDIIVFDLETRFHAERFTRTTKPFKKAPPELGEFDPGEVKIGNLKDEAKIEAKIEQAEIAHRENHAEALEKWNDDLADDRSKKADKAALYPGQSEICAIGWQLPGEKPQTLLLDEDVETEETLVRSFLEIFEQVTESPMTAGGNFKFAFYSGNNKRDGLFDYLHLREAVRRNRIAVNHAFLVAPGQRHSPWMDLAQEFLSAGAILPQCDGYPAYLSLDDAVNYLGRDPICHSAGIGEPPEGFDQVLSKIDVGVTGAEFGEAMRDPEQVDECRLYLENDLALTRILADNSIMNLVK